jgi:hypothetical protein
MSNAGRAVQSVIGGDPKRRRPALLRSAITQIAIAQRDAWDRGPAERQQNSFLGCVALFAGRGEF